LNKSKLAQAGDSSTTSSSFASLKAISTASFHRSGIKDELDPFEMLDDF